MRSCGLGDFSSDDVIFCGRPDIVAAPPPVSPIMPIFVPRETHPTERRVPLLPNGAAKLAKTGAEIEIEQGLGTPLHCADSEYQSAGATISTDRVRSLAGADVVLRLRKP